MQVTQTSADGLKREFHIVVPNAEVESQIASRLDELGRTIRLPGFRPGKVPAQLLRRRFGQTVRGEVMETTLQNSTAEAIREHNLRPALPPKVDIVSFAEGADLEYRMSVELLPEIPEPSFADLGIERLVVEIPDEDIDRAIERLAEQQRQSEIVDRPAESGDILVADIEGRVEDRAIPGASGTNRQIVLGTGNFIQGFEEQLIGAVAGEQRTIRLTFPADYGVADLAGREAVFAVDVKEVQQRAPLVIDDSLGRAVGLESLAELREEVQQRMRRDYAAAARLRLKRALLDKLAERHDFLVPAGMVDLEFDAIWAAHQATPPPVDSAGAGEVGGEAAAVAGGEAAADSAGEAAADSADAPAGVAADEALRAAYHKIAERRVRLGLLLAEVGRNNNISVTQEELNQAIIREARRHVGHERRVLDLYRQHPEAVARLRAPIFEDKVIDFIIELAKLDERHVSPQELFSMPEPEGEDAAPVEPPT
jgi:trigger factor